LEEVEIYLPKHNFKAAKLVMILTLCVNFLKEEVRYSLTKYSRITFFLTSGLQCCREDSQPDCSSRIFSEGLWR